MHLARSPHLAKCWPSILVLLLSPYLICHASVISVNFSESAANQKIAPSTAAGLGAESNWNNTNGAASGSLKKLVNSHGAPTTANLEWSSNSMWGDLTADKKSREGIGDAQIRRGYLDDTKGGPLWTVRDIPYGHYSVIVYFSGDSNDGSFRPVVVNGTQHQTEGTKATYSNQSKWNASNSILVTNLSGPLRVSLLNRSGSSRATVAGFQILRTQAPPSSATLIGIGDLSIKLWKHE